MIMNHKKLYRLYTEEKLGVRRRRGRKRARGSRTPMPVALRPGERPLSVMQASPVGQWDPWILCLTRLAHLASSVCWL